MTQRPGLGKTRHKWLINDAAGDIQHAQTLCGRIIVEIRREQERPGRPQFQDIAMLMAELTQALSKAAGLVDEMGDLVERAESSSSDTEQLLDMIADLSAEVRRLAEKVG
jgi:hypothetical protein